MARLSLSQPKRRRRNRRFSSKAPTPAARRLRGLSRPSAASRRRSRTAPGRRCHALCSHRHRSPRSRPGCRVGVAEGPIAGQLGRRVADAKTVSARADCDVAPKHAVIVLLRDKEPGAGTSSDPIPEDAVVPAAQLLGLIEPEADAPPARVDDDVAGDRLAWPRSSPMSPPSETRFRTITLRLPRARIPPSPTMRLPRTWLRSASRKIPGLLSKNRLPLIRFSVESNTWMPGPGLRRISLSTIRRWRQPNTPIPSPSGAMLWLNEPPRIKLRNEPPTAAPRRRGAKRKCSRPGSSVRPRPAPRSRTRAPTRRRTVTPSWPSLAIPRSQGSVIGSHPGNSVPSPSIRCPSRSRVMSSAPITMPLLGQLTRSPVERGICRDRVAATHLALRRPRWHRGPNHRVRARQRRRWSRSRSRRSSDGESLRARWIPFSGDSRPAHPVTRQRASQGAPTQCGRGCEVSAFHAKRLGRFSSKAAVSGGVCLRLPSRPSSPGGIGEAESGTCPKSSSRRRPVTYGGRP